ncbi:capZ-interacting protein [Lampris incognitus]|uniref:capZ-interacting protein n=1 Tax=Lampris incognitus TaxID=2546036 RepID=UPI0024B4C856|nr:capZ-interacting protein [Lampris incognitus]
MEKDSPFKPSVAELAGRFRGHVLPSPPQTMRLIRRRPPCSLKLQSQKDDGEESDKPAIISPNPFKIKMKNSPIIEKLQANLALSPTALLPSPKSPDVKLQPTPLTPATPCGPLCPSTQPSRQSSEEEEPVSFESPPEGAPLLSINKTRARLSFKRRLPTRQHRRSGGDFGRSLSPCELHSPSENSHEDGVFDDPEEECERGSSPTDAATLREPEETDLDCAKTEDKVTESALTQRGGPDSPEESDPLGGTRAEEAEGQDAESCSAEPIEGTSYTEKKSPREEAARGEGKEKV